MAKIIEFPKKGNAEIHIEAEFKYADDLKANMLDIQLRRIKDSLIRINELMRSLKETTNTSKELESEKANS